MKSLALIPLLLLSTAALAQGEETAPTVIYKTITELELEGLDIDGTIVRPASILSIERRRAIFNPMINLRVDFDQEMSSSVDEVK